MSAIIEIKNEPYPILSIEIDRESGDLIICQEHPEIKGIINSITVQKKKIGELFQQILKRYLWEIEEEIQERDEWERKVLNWQEF